MTPVTRFALPLLASVLALSMAAAFTTPSAELIAVAKSEGMLTTIALPYSWRGYGAAIEGFKAKCGRRCLS